MATLTVWRFPDADGAEQALSTLEDLQKQQLIKVHDGALVTWPAGAKKPKARQLHHPVGVGALGGSFWGLLFGLIFFVPLLGLAVGAAGGALAGAMTDVGGVDAPLVAGWRQVPAGCQRLRGGYRPTTTGGGVLPTHLAVETIMVLTRICGGVSPEEGLSAALLARRQFYRAWPDSDFASRFPAG